MSIDGHIYGVSSCTVSPAIYYNKDIFDAAGVAYPPRIRPRPGPGTNLSRPPRS
jgi:ABC-type glycerol-3-phosphate transport system substrate-binding protein